MPRKKTRAKAKARPKRITVEWLRQRRACGDQIDLFRRVFPRGASLTVKNFDLAERLGLDTIWLAHRLLPRDAMEPILREDALQRLSQEVFAQTGGPARDNLIRQFRLYRNSWRRREILAALRLK